MPFILAPEYEIYTLSTAVLQPHVIIAKQDLGTNTGTVYDNPLTTHPMFEASRR